MYLKQDFVSTKADQAYVQRISLMFWTSGGWLYFGGGDWFIFKRKSGWVGSNEFKKWKPALVCDA